MRSAYSSTGSTTTTSAATTRVVRFRSADGSGVTPASRAAQLLFVDQPLRHIHNVGQLQFDAKGYLYVRHGRRWPRRATAEKSRARH